MKRAENTAHKGLNKHPGVSHVQIWQSLLKTWRQLKWRRFVNVLAPDRSVCVSTDFSQHNILTAVQDAVVKLYNNYS